MSLSGAGGGGGDDDWKKLKELMELLCQDKKLRRTDEDLLHDVLVEYMKNPITVYIKMRESIEWESLSARVRKNLVTRMKNRTKDRLRRERHLSPGPIAEDRVGTPPWETSDASARLNELASTLSQTARQVMLLLADERGVAEICSLLCLKQSKVYRMWSEIKGKFNEGCAPLQAKVKPAKPARPSKPVKHLRAPFANDMSAPNTWGWHHREHLANCYDCQMLVASLWREHGICPSDEQIQRHLAGVTSLKGAILQHWVDCKSCRKRKYEEEYSTADNPITFSLPQGAVHREATSRPSFFQTFAGGSLLVSFYADEDGRFKLKVRCPEPVSPDSPSFVKVSIRMDQRDVEVLLALHRAGELGSVGAITLSDIESIQQGFLHAEWCRGENH